MNIKLNIKECSKCSSWIPRGSGSCEICDGLALTRNLTEDEKSIPFKMLINEIDNAYFKIENFGNGTLLEYSLFNFLKYFKILFLKANYTIENCKRITHYWHLNEQAFTNYERRNFVSAEAYYNDDFCLDCISMGEVNELLVAHFQKFMQKSDFDLSFDISILDLSNTLKADRTIKNTLTISKAKDLQFIPGVLEPLYSSLKGFFTDQDSFYQALKGNNLEYPILFPSQQNKLVEVFKRLHNSGRMISSKTETCNWLCKNFTYQFKKGENVSIKPFNRSTVWDILSKNKVTNKKELRTCIVDWLSNY